MITLPFRKNHHPVPIFTTILRNRCNQILKAKYANNQTEKIFRLIEFYFIIYTLKPYKWHQ
ncbi:MAG: hypothetical protein ACJAS1_005082 [Oleiphilaceae bacterium]|jgi:hypothetical protein